jgi:hypothetical protein
MSARTSLVVLLTVAGVVAGCGHAKSHQPAVKAPKLGWRTPTHPALPTKAEFEWTERLYSWLLQLEGSLNADPAFTLIRRCETALRTDVGPPPSVRVRPLRRQASIACMHFRRGAAFYLAGAPAAKGDREFDRGFRLRDALLEKIQVAALVDLNRPLPAVAVWDRRSRIELTLSRVASKVAGKRIEARCWTKADWAQLEQQVGLFSGPEVGGLAGYADFGAARVHLSPSVCKPLVDFAYRKVWPDAREDLAFAFGVLAHESQHAVGVESERVAECRGMQQVREVAKGLGASAAAAAEAARLYWEVIYPSALPSYQSRACRNGGALDLRPDSDVWP